MPTSTASFNSQSPHSTKRQGLSGPRPAPSSTPPAIACRSRESIRGDARHRHETVCDDVILLHPKLRAGGILAGHDDLDGTIDGDLFGVKQAVDEFAA